MTPDEFRQFTDRLAQGLAPDPDVLGLVLLGSASGEGAAPDRWSDHDFFVVVRPGAQERFRRELGWLPDAGEIAFSFRETAHGVTALYRSGHLVECAVFDPEEIALARVNRFRVALDRADVAERMARVRAATAAAPPADDRREIGQLLASLAVGVGRWRRGERLAGAECVRSRALGHLLRLVAAHVPPGDPAAPDALDPFRRFERAWPRLAAEIHAALSAEVPEAAAGMLALAAREIGARAEIPREAVAAVVRAMRVLCDEPGPHDAGKT